MELEVGDGAFLLLGPQAGLACVESVNQRFASISGEEALLAMGNLCVNVWRVGIVEVLVGYGENFLAFNKVLERGLDIFFVARELAIQIGSQELIAIDGEIEIMGIIPVELLN
jgi:hypothetical protein